MQAKQNDLRVLMAMGVGLHFDDETVLSSFKDEKFPKKHRTQFIPNNKILIDEILRRKRAKGDRASANRQMRQSVAMEWLISNPVTSDEDRKFVLSGITTFLEANIQAEREKADKTRDQWSGIHPFIRLIHCIVDSESTMEAFQKSFTTMNRDELDGQNNTATMRRCVWDMISQKFNKQEFNPTSTIYLDLHDDFRANIDISHAKVASMGVLTPDKAKSKFFYLKNDLLIMKANWEKSGNGDGSVVDCKASFDSNENAISMTNANDKRNFLNGRSPAVLYLWKKAEEHNLLNTVCQQLTDEAAFDSATGAAALPISTRIEKKKSSYKKENESESQAIISALNRGSLAVEKSNRIAEKSNHIASEDQWLKINTIIGEKQNAIDEIEDKLEDTLMTGFSETKRFRLQKKLKRLREEVNILEKKRKRCEVSEMN